MIISASRRTDIPAFFAKEFSENLHNGFINVPNPFNPKQISRVSLRPEDVTAFVFWTRNAKPFIPVIKKLLDKNYNFYFLYTVTPYGPPLEPHAPDLERATDNFSLLSSLIGKKKVIWRYDPIIISNHTDFRYHLENFHHIARNLHTKTEKVKISFIDYYKKVKKNLKDLENSGWVFEPHPEKMTEFSHFITELGKIASRYGLEVTSCCEPLDLTAGNINPGSCIDAALLNTLFNLQLPLKKDRSQRKNCLCTIAKDIGRYNSCRFGCRYCYACRY